MGVDFSTVIYFFFLHLPYKNPHPKPSQILGFGASLVVSSFMFVVSAQDQLFTARMAVLWQSLPQYLDENLPQVSHWWVYLSFPSHLW